MLVVAPPAGARLRELKTFVCRSDPWCGVRPWHLTSSSPSTSTSASRGARRAPALVLGLASVYCDVIDPSSLLKRIERIEPDAALLARAHAALPEAHVLPIATAGRVGGGAACEVEAMEGFGVLRACALAGVPAVELRAVSNAPEEADRGTWSFEDAFAALGDAVTRVLASS